MELDVLVTPGLGDNSFLVSAGGDAVVIDPQRDVARFLHVAESRGVKIRHVLETHVHNDYVSGALEIREATGAEIAAPARGGYRFEHRPMAEGDEIILGDLSLVAMETPGHTPEHMSYLLKEAGSGRPVAVFTGGSLMVGSAGRTDLLGPELTDELTRAQFRTLRRLASLPDDVQVLPTHGAGSFCGTGPAPKERTSTMGQERIHNRALAAADEDVFVRQQLSGLLAYPTYYRYMGPINRSGPRLLRDYPRPRGLSPEEVAARMESGVWVLDGRWRVQFARAHITGSLNVELDETFGSYTGWVVPFGDPLLLVLPEPVDESLEEAVTQLLRVGYEGIEGYLEGGIDAWRAEGRRVASYRVAGLEELCRSYRAGKVGTILDVRQQSEWDQGHIPGSQHVFVGDLPDRIGEVPGDGEVWAICASGHRASMAASLLAREGRTTRLVEGTGVSDFLAHCPPRDESP
ncbi:MAG TPA: rhodanese-like domain-containing protein [Actinomycetota bacterium]|jgi:glyoxylase-like metal-dependent hydrolase (beta-lactamase superfamily II)/rhodanese-related sulfurtransferase